MNLMTTFTVLWKGLPSFIADQNLKKIFKDIKILLMMVGSRDSEEQF